MKKLLLITMLMPLMALAYETNVGGVTWSYDVWDGKAEVTGANPASGTVAIPSSLGVYPVTSVRQSAFDGCSALVSVTIPSSVTSIEGDTFYGCSGLTSILVDANNSLYSSQSGILYNKTKSELICCPGGKTGAVTIPSSVMSIVGGAISRCSGLTSISVDVNNPSYSSQSGILYNKTKSRLICCPRGKTGAVTIPSSVTCIEWCAFEDCCGLTSVTIPSSVTSIQEIAFGNCSRLTSISVSASNPSYSSQSGILYNKTKSELICCPGGKTGVVTIPSSVTSIGLGGFLGCSGLTSVTIPSSVMSIGKEAFGYCSGLTSVTIPSSVTSIELWAFCGCSGLTSVTIPSSVASIDRLPFDGCSSLKTIYVASGDAQRIKNLLSSSGEDVNGFRFVESGTAGEWDGDDGGGAGVKDPFDGNEKHVFNGLVRDKKKSPCGLIQVTTAKATKKGVKVSGFVMLEDGKKVTMKAVTVAVEKKLLNVGTTVGKLGSISLTVGGNGFTGTLGDKKVASEKLDEDAGVLKTTVKVTYLDAATGKLKTKNMTLNGVAVPQSAAGVLTSKGGAAKKFEAVVDCEACRPE